METVRGATGRLRSGTIRSRYPRSVFASTFVHTVVLGVGCTFGLRYATAAADEPVRVATRFVAAVAPESRSVVEEPLETEIPDEEWIEPELVPVDYDPAPVTYDDADLAEPPEDDLSIEDLPLVSLAIQPAPPEPQPEAVAVEPPPAEPEPVVLIRREPPRLVHAPDPQYPRLSSRLGEEGSVLCLLHVGADGSVTRLEVEESSGHARLDDAACGALASWRFHPATLGGEPIPSEYRHRVRFELGA